MKFSLYCFCFVLFSFSVFAADKFGQNISAEMNSQLLQARELRLPYEDDYNPALSISILEELVREKPDYYRARYNLALAYSEIGEYKKSKLNFDKAIEIQNKSPQIIDATVYNSAGWVSMKEGDFERAENLFKQGVALSGNNDNNSNRLLFNNLGQLYFVTGRHEEAKEYLEKAEKYNSGKATETLEIIKQVEQKKSN